MSTVAIMPDPSGNQSKAETAWGRSVSLRASPPSVGSSQIWRGAPVALAPGRRKESSDPSGDQEGAESEFPEVSRRGSPPAKGAHSIQETRSPPSTCPRTYATTVPSGEIAGDDTPPNSNTISGPIGVFISVLPSARGLD